ncbi:MAG TPA: 2-oxoacid:acceptor oxidoreductase family protein, partial [Vicinamibacteria bacterium]|nr:2-oxoacid:acceptor oxidoreductase family protein [Vicinamibacteria bacterium]
AKDVQEAADLNLVAHRIAELSLTPGLLAQDAYLTSDVIASLALPEPALVKEYLGDPADRIDSPTRAQGLVFGDVRRRIPEMFDLDHPLLLGALQGRDSYAQGVAAQRPFYFDHVAELADQAFREFAALTGRRYARASSHRLEDAEWVIVGQGSVVADAEAVADHLRDERGLKVGVLNLTMFRPFPADLVTAMLVGRKGVVVMERVDQPLAADAPLLREIRAALSKGQENGRVSASHAGLFALRGGDVPEFYSACFGLGGRDLQPGDIAAAVQNMTPPGAGRRHFYLGVDFMRPGTRLPKLQIWQDKLSEGYPQVGALALPPAGDLDLRPKGAVALRIHSLGGWGVEEIVQDIARSAFDAFGLQVKASPNHGTEKNGQPVTSSVVLSPEPVRLNAEPVRFDVVLSPDPLVFRHADPLKGLVDGGVLVVQTDLVPEEFWKSLTGRIRRVIVERGIRVHCLDAIAIARAEVADADGQRRMQAAAFLGAFMGAAPLLTREAKGEAALFKGMGARWRETLGATAAEDKLRAMRRGLDEVKTVVPVDGPLDAERGGVPHMPALIEAPMAQPGPGHEGRFWEQVCSIRALGQDGIADPFAAIGAIPAATAAVRDLSGLRFEAPEFIGTKCTGCAECWMQCPDSAIPGLVNSVDDVLGAALDVATHGSALERLRPLARNWGRETHKLLQKDASLAVGLAFALAYDTVASKMGWDTERRAKTDAEFQVVQARLAEFPLARTQTFFGDLEAKAKGTGGLLSVTVNPDACKGCNLCVEVCAPGALVSAKQDEPGLSRLRRNWELWNRLPDTDNRFLQAADSEAGFGVLSSLLLKKDTYRSMVGGDGACSGCGEKTAAHLVLSAIEAQMAPRVAKHVAKLDGLIEGLDARARTLLASGADLHAAARAKGSVAVPVNEGDRAQLERITRAADALRDLRWRYAEGPSGKGRASVGMANATGCSSTWASAYPFNPYPFPWVSHLTQDSPSIAIGLFEAHMRKMADGFADLRRASKLLDGTYDPGADEEALAALGWKEFTDEEFLLCPPIVAMGGDGAMLGSGFQNLSSVLSSGRPIRVVILDTQGHSDTGQARRGRTAASKDADLLAIAHRGVFVHQSSQASPAHLLAGVLRGLNQRRPAFFNLYTPCPKEHGLADEGAARAARLALESRAFPFLTYDPEGGPSFAACLSLAGNPSPDADWPAYTLRYLDDAGGEQSMSVPLTVADWAATEGRFREHFADLPREEWDAAVAFDQYLRMPRGERGGTTAFIHAIGPDRRLRRLRVDSEMAGLAEDRLEHWSQLRQLAGLEVSEAARQSVAGALEAGFEAKLVAMRAEYEARIAQLKREYPQQIARRLAEGLMKHGGGGALSELLATLPATGPSSKGSTAKAPAAAPAPAAPAAPEAPSVPAAPAKGVEAAPPSPAAEAPEDEPLTLEAYIDSARCTSCNECVNLNKKMFVYNAAKQAELKDASAGTFQQLVLAAERCPVSIIHPGSPTNPNEKDLEKWVKRAEKFN